MNPSATVIGQFYDVPCAFSSGWRNFHDWIPVIGPAHEDSEFIKFAEVHWHIDWRFASEQLLRMFRKRSVPLAALPLSLKNAPGGITVRRIKCRNLFPRMLAPWLPALEQAFAGKRMENMICPHKGMPLAGCPTINGVVVCCGHGLAWDIKTGKLARRIPG